jgi:hypothetical protein
MLDQSALTVVDSFKFKEGENSVSERIITKLDVSIVYRLNCKYKRRSNFTAILPNFLVKLPKISAVIIPEIKLENILKKFDESYCGTLMYLNPYAQIFMDDPKVIYKTLSFVTPKYETFEDDDLSFCTYEQFIDSINILKRNFCNIYNFPLESLQ